jgi:hypothetical protein
MQPFTSPSPGRVRIVSPATHRARDRAGFGRSRAFTPPGEPAPVALRRALRRVAIALAPVLAVAAVLPAAAAQPLTASQSLAAAVVVSGLLPSAAVALLRLYHQRRARTDDEETPR